MIRFDSKLLIESLVSLYRAAILLEGPQRVGVPKKRVYLQVRLSIWEFDSELVRLLRFDVG